MKRAIALLALILPMLGGCGSYTQAQVRLTEQARQGLDLCRSAEKERQGLVEQYHQSQRQRLDEAFDADVRLRVDLSPAWVIEHRKAYTAALEVLYRQRQASLEAQAVTERNLDTIDSALARLLALQAVQARLPDLEEILRPLGISKQRM